MPHTSVPVPRSSRGHREEPLRTALTILLIALLPSLLLTVLGEWLFMNRPLVVYEYFAVALAVPVLPTAVAAVLFAAVLAADLLVALSPGFHFSAAALIESLAGVAFLDEGALLRMLLPAVAAVFLTAGALAFIGGRLSFTVRSALASLVLCVLATTALHAADSAMSPTNKRRSEQAPLDLNVAGALYKSVRKSVRASRRSDEIDGATGRTIASASQPLFDRLGEAVPRADDLFLIVVESLSLYREAAANALQAAPLLEHPDVLKRFSVRTGSVPFNGPTVSGELRELCRTEFLLAVPLPEDVPAERCLPTLLAGAGYEAVAVNGYYPSFFNTSAMYRAAGFEEAYFAGSVAAGAGRGRKCGSTFRGACDNDAARFLADLVASRSAPGRRNFYYWMTLNGHVPVSVPRSYDGYIDCAASRTTAEHDGLCASVETNSVVMHEIATTLVEAIDPDRRTTIVVVGDHAAPFLDRELRAALDDGRVPWYVLESRTTVADGP